MRWTDVVVSKLQCDFGGIPTFCIDSDNLVENSSLREALRQKGMEITNWDGNIDYLITIRSLSESEKPLLIVQEGVGEYVVQTHLADYRWEFISIGGLMPKFALEVVKSVPTEHWDRLIEIHNAQQMTLNSTDTALLIARTIYGVDTEYIKHPYGWIRLLAALSLSEDPLPLPIANATERECRSWQTHPNHLDAKVLADPATCRATLLTAIKENPALIDILSPMENVLVNHLKQSHYRSTMDTAPSDLIGRWDELSVTAIGVLEFGMIYAQAVYQEQVSDAIRDKLNTLFVSWIRKEYMLMLSAPNTQILRLPTLLDRLERESEDRKLLLLVVDSLSLRAWLKIKGKWIGDGLINRTEDRAAFAIIPTVTSLSRRALFEGKIPSQFSKDSHSQALERKLWLQKYQSNGDYFSATETSGIQESLMRGRNRICIVDLSWDKRGHGINPGIDSIVEAAQNWATKTSLRNAVQAGLKNGYRVVITSDHGLVECSGQGRPNVGTLPEERSKRVLIFGNKILAAHHTNDNCALFHPPNLSGDTWPVFASGFTSFDLFGVDSVSHGGMSIEEVVVPVVELFA